MFGEYEGRKDTRIEGLIGEKHLLQKFSEQLVKFHLWRTRLGVVAASR